MEKLEEEYNKIYVRKIYKEVIQVKKRKAGTRMFIEDKNDNLLGKTEDIKTRWKEYINDLFDESMLKINEGTVLEIRNMLNQMQNNKSLDENSVNAEMLK